MPENPLPREVVERLLHWMSDRSKWPELAGLYAEDAVVEISFAPPKPVRLEGRAALAEHFAAASDLLVVVRVENVVLHETTDPEVIIAEFDYDGRATGTGRTFRVPNILVIRVRDGKIASSRDYHNHVVTSAALGRLPELVSALTAE
jgi:uncharacterized protein